TLVQFTTSGALDGTFGSGGLASAIYPVGFNFDTFTGSFVSLSAIALQSNGEVVAVGSVENDTPTSFTTSFLATRFLASGAVDTTFGSGGWVTGQDPASAVLVQKDGSIVTVGSMFNPNQLIYDYWLAEFNSNGSLVFSVKHKHSP